MKEWEIPIYCPEIVHNKFAWIFNTYFYYYCYRDVINLLKTEHLLIVDIYGGDTKFSLQGQQNSIKRKFVYSLIKFDWCVSLCINIFVVRKLCEK